MKGNTEEHERLYTMQEACMRTGMRYEALKFYCNNDLVLGVRRNGRNHRVFTEYGIRWIEGLVHLRRCGMSIAEIGRYKDLYLEGESSIPERSRMLADLHESLLARRRELDGELTFLAGIRRFYDDLLAGHTAYPDLQPLPPDIPAADTRPRASESGSH